MALSLYGLRCDGRKPAEIRKMRAKFGISPNANGSLLYEQGNTKVLANVVGPHQIGKSSVAGISSATSASALNYNINCDNSNSTNNVSICVSITAPTFSSSRIPKDPKNQKQQLNTDSSTAVLHHSGGAKFAYLSAQLEQALYLVVQTEMLPRNSQIDVFIEILQLDGGLMCACANGASLALLDAGIPMAAILSSANIGIHFQTPQYTNYFMEENIVNDDDTNDNYDMSDNDNNDKNNLNESNLKLNNHNIYPNEDNPNLNTNKTLIPKNEKINVGTNNEAKNKISTTNINNVKKLIIDNEKGKITMGEKEMDLYSLGTLEKTSDDDDKSFDEESSDDENFSEFGNTRFPAAKERGSLKLLVDLNGLEDTATMARMGQTKTGLATYSTMPIVTVLVRIQQKPGSKNAPQSGDTAFTKSSSSVSSPLMNELSSADNVDNYSELVCDVINMDIHNRLPYDMIDVALDGALNVAKRVYVMLVTLVKESYVGQKCPQKICVPTYDFMD